jgi:hypothetical protein
MRFLKKRVRIVGNLVKYWGKEETKLTSKNFKKLEGYTVGGPHGDSIHWNNPINMEFGEYVWDSSKQIRFRRMIIIGTAEDRDEAQKIVDRHFRKATMAILRNVLTGFQILG